MPQPLILKIDVDDRGRPKIEKLEVSMKDLERQSHKSSTAIGAFGKSVNKAGSLLRGTVNQVFSLKTAFIALGAAYAGLRMGRMIKGWIDYAGAQEAAEKGMRQVMISMNRYSDVGYKSYLKTASALQKLTGVGDEAIITGQKFLLTFKQIPDSAMPRTTKAMLDLSALMGGDVTRAALTLGKAAMGMTGELRRVGITVDQDTFKTKGYLGVLKEIEEQVKGQAVTFRETWLGTMMAFQSEMGDVKEIFGATFQRLVQPVMEDIIKLIQSLKEEGRLDDWAKNMATAFIDVIDVATPAVNVIIQMAQLGANAFLGWVMIIDSIKVGIGKLREEFAQWELKILQSDITKWSVSAGLGGVAAPWVAKKWDERKASLEAELYGPTDVMGPMAPKGVLAGREQQEQARSHLEKVMSLQTSLNELTNAFQSNMTTKVPAALEKMKRSIGEVAEEEKKVYQNMEKTTESISEAEKAWAKIDRQKRMAGIAERLAQWRKTDFDTVWKGMVHGMEDSFVDGFAKMLQSGLRGFKDFGKQLIKIFTSTMAQMFSERLIRPFAKTLVDSITSPLKGIMGGVMGKAGGLGEMFGGIGAAGGLTILGGIGAGIAGLTNLFGRKTERQDVVLKWSVEGGEAQQVMDYWSGGAEKNTELLAQVNSTIDSILDMYVKMGDFSNTVLQNVEITIDSLGNRISEIQLESARIGYEFATSNIELLTQLFGGAMPTEAMQEVERLEQERQTLMAGGWQQFKTGRGSYGATAAILQYQHELSALEQAQTEILGTFDESIEELFTKFSDFSDEFSQIIGTAFSDALNTSEFGTFKTGLKKGVYESFKNALLQEFTTTALHDVLTSMWGSFGITGWGDVVQQAMSGDTAGAMGLVNEMVSSIDAIEPAFNALTEIITAMEESLGVNTEAVVDNTSAITRQEQVQEFINQLTTGGLAPAQSVGAITGRYQELLQGENLSDLFSFITGTMLPFFQTYGGSYQDVFSGVIGDLQNLAGFGAAGLSPTAIGEAVAGAITPALGGAQTIHVTVEVDGVAIGEVLLDQLQTNPELQQQVIQTVQ